MSDTFPQMRPRALRRPATSPQSVGLTVPHRERGSRQVQGDCGIKDGVPQETPGLELNAERNDPSVAGDGCTQKHHTGVSPTSFVKLCNFCAQQGTLHCVRCRRVCYCSVACQINDWSAHWHVCKPDTAGQAMCEKSQELSDSLIRTGSRCLVSKDDPGEVTSLQKLYLHNLPRNEVTKGAQIQATVVELRNPGKFFIHIRTQAAMESLQSMTVALQKMYAGSLGMEYMPDYDEACGVMYSQDRKWYRGVVQSVNVAQKTAAVFYMDYGNEEVVTLDRIRPLASCVGAIPPCAVQCRVAGVTVVTGGWCAEGSIAVRQLVGGRTLTVTVLDTLDSGVWAVDVELTTIGKKLSSFLVENGYAAMEPSGQDIDSILSAALKDFKKSSAGKNENTDSSAASPLTLDVGDSFSVTVTHLRSPDELSCQKLDNSRAIRELQRHLQDHCAQGSPGPDFRPVPGTMCCCQFSEDSQWYRAKVLASCAERRVYVSYVDFGNSEEVDLERLRPIRPDLLKLPIQAIPCALAGVRPTSDAWMEASVVMLRKTVCNRFLQMKVLGLLGGSALVSLTDKSSDPQMDVAEVLVATGYALACKGDEAPRSSAAAQPKEELQWTCVELPADGQLVDIMVTMIESPGQFYCRLHSSEGTRSLAALMADLAKHCQRGDATLVASVGQPCCALFPGDGSWYRVLVQATLPDGKLEVYFVDYGNTSVVDRANLRTVTPEQLKVPFQAMRCWLSGVEPLGRQWSRKALQKFQALCAGTCLQCSVLSITESSYGVELLRGGVSIAALLVADRLAIYTTQSLVSVASDDTTVQMVAAPPSTGSFPTNWKTVKLPSGEMFQAHVAAVISPGHFYLLNEKEESAEKLHRLMGALAEHCSRHPHDCSVPPEPGAACCAQFSGDDKWYRAVVLGTTDSEAGVVYADYGNSERVPLSSLRPIASRHLEPPFRIVRCGLAGKERLPSKWPPSAVQLFQSMLKARVLASVQEFDGTYNLLTLTGRTDGGGVQINSVMEDSLVKKREETAAKFCSRDTGVAPGTTDHMEKMGKEAVKSKAQPDTRNEEEPRISPETSKDVPRSPQSLCCCADLKQKVDQIEALLLLIMRQLAALPKP